MFKASFGVAGGGASALAMAKYLTEKQLDTGAMKAAAYYGQTAGTDEAIATDVGCIPTPRADMTTEVAVALGVDRTKTLSVDQLANLLAGKKTDGTPLEGAQREVADYGEGDQQRYRLAYMDFNLSSSKGLSVAWALSETEAERNSLLQAHRTANAEVLRYIEDQIGWARTGHGGEGKLERAKIGWITVDHYTARPTETKVRIDPETGKEYTEEKSINVTGDPQIHSHNLVPSVMVTESGRVVALNTQLLHGRGLEFGAVYDAILARELNALGVETFVDSKTNKLALTAIPQEVCDEFSKRSRDAEKTAKAYAAKQGADWDALTDERKTDFLAYGARASRRDKETNTPDMQAWREQAERIGYKHRSIIAYGPPAPPRTYSERMSMADELGQPHLAEMLSKRAVIGQGDVRLAAARGFMSAGINDPVADMNAMMKHWAQGAVHQDGKATKLIWREAERGRVKLTTELHRDQETELIALARRAVEDRTHALLPGAVEMAVARSGLVFKGEHGDAQRHAIEVLGTDGGLAVAVGVAGAGKTTLLSPLVAAWQAQGYTVWGTADANRQATNLTETGIEYIHTRAMKPLLDSLNGGRAALDRNSVLVLDELGRIGTRELLELLQHRERIGFKLVAVGDDRQCSAIEAGAVIELLRKAIGAERIPEILTTVRQKSEEERRIANLFREGKAGEAIATKRENGTAELVAGSYREAIERIAALYGERRRATHNQPDYCITISAPTNTDAREISRAVREVRRNMGEVGKDAVIVAATDGHGAGYNLTLAQGDNVRLFMRTRATFKQGDGRGKSANIGDNGTILHVEAVMPHEGLMLRGESGKIGFVSWRNLQERGGSDRVWLGYGDCLTIDSSQGITSDEHIDAMPAGSSLVSSFKSYVANSRHRVRSHMIGSMGAEMREVRANRPSGLPVMTPNQAADAAWANLTKNLEKRPTKELALEFMEKAVVRRRETVKVFQGALRTHEARRADGKDATTVKQTAQIKQVHEALPQINATLRETVRQQVAVRESLNAMHDYWSDREGRRIDVAARLVSEGDMPFSDALDRVISAELQDRRRGVPVDSIHGIPKVLPGAEPVEKLEERLSERLMAAMDAYEAKQVVVESAPRQKVAQSA